MIAETSRKRRRLEREQRALQKPVPGMLLPFQAIGLVIKVSA
jgi:hypothetical protein